MTDLDNAVVSAMIKAKEIGVKMLASDCEAILKAAIASIQGEANTDGFTLVPIKETRAMQLVFQQEDWEWRDVLAAAEAITEDEYYAPDSAARIAELEQQLEVARNKLGETIKTLAWACDSFESSYCGFSAKSKATLKDIGIENTAILNILGKGTIPPDQAIDAAIRQIGGAE